MIGIELATYVAMQRWFNRKRILANGIATSGTGFGMLVMGPLIQWLLSFYGLRGTFLILSGVALNGTVCALFIPSTYPDENTKISELSQLLDPQDSLNYFHKEAQNTDENGYYRLLKNGQYILYALGSAIHFTVFKAATGNTQICVALA